MNGTCNKTVKCWKSFKTASEQQRRNQRFRNEKGRKKWRGKNREDEKKKGEQRKGKGKSKWKIKDKATRKIKNERTKKIEERMREGDRDRRCSKWWVKGPSLSSSTGSLRKPRLRHCWKIYRMENVVRRIVPEQSQFPAMQSFIPYARLTAILNDAFPYSRGHFSAIPLRTLSRAAPKFRALKFTYTISMAIRIWKPAPVFPLSIILPCIKIIRELIIILRDIPALCNCIYFATSLLSEFNASHFLATFAKFTAERFTAKVILTYSIKFIIGLDSYILLCRASYSTISRLA